MAQSWGFSLCSLRNSRIAVPCSFPTVGNIPYDMSEEQLIDVFREVGTVVGFR